MDYTTSDLITLVKEKETIPDSGAAYSDDTLLRYLDQSLKAFIVPAVESVFEEHFVVTRDYVIPQFQQGGNPPVDIPNALPIPSESTGLRLRDVYVVANDGSFYNIPRLTPTQAASQNWGSSAALNSTWFSGANALYGGFFLQGNTVQIFPYGLAAGKTVRLTFQRAPADLCSTEEAGKVVQVNGDVLTLDKVVTGWFSGITRVSITSGLAPHDYVIDASVPVPVYTTPAMLMDVTLVTVAGNVVTLPPGLVGNVQPGDWVCPIGQSVYAQNIPRELMPALVQKAAEMCIHAAGDKEGTQEANKEFNNMMKLALMMIAPRTIGKPVKVLPTNSAFKASRAGNLGRW